MFGDPVEVDTVAGGDVGGGGGGLSHRVVSVLPGGDGLDTCTHGGAQQGQLTHDVGLRLRCLVHGDALEAEAVLTGKVNCHDVQDNCHEVQVKYHDVQVKWHD